MSDLPDAPTSPSTGSVRAAKIRTVFQANIALVVATVSAALVDPESESAMPARWITSLAIMVSCATTLVLVRTRPAWSFRWSTLSLQAIILATPWFTGGIQRPMTYLEIPLLVYSSILLGIRFTWRIAVPFCLNLLALAWFESNGAIASSPLPPVTHFVVLLECAVFGLYLVANPIALTQDLLRQARHDNSRRQEHQKSLSRMKEALDARIEERERELRRVRQRLIHSTETLTSLYEPIIQRIGVRARYIQDALVGREESVQFPIGRILIGCERLAAMHKAISRYSKIGPRGIQTKELAPDELQAMIRQIWDEIRLSFPRADHRLFLNGLKGCKADPDMLNQVWQHILSNAAKFSARQPRPRIVVGWKNGEYFVNDNGVGFDATNAKSLFELFNRQHRAGEFQGNGIGLASTKRILELHSGTIRVESAPGKGATVFFSLPSAGN